MKKITVAGDSSELIPEFDLISSLGGKRLKLRDLRQQANLVIFFYDGWSCDHCRRLLRSLREQHELFKWLDAKVIAVSSSPLGDLPAASAELEPEIILLADEEGTVTRSYAEMGGGGEAPFMVIADRFGALFTWMSFDRDEEIDFHEVEATLLFIATQCPECGRPQGDSQM